ncbi:response regulator [bacterium]|nr:MAG: response regulator [bacterium]
MKRVLLVEDNDFIRKMYLMKLGKSESIEVLEAADGPAALEVYQAQKPDLILLDIMMPKMSGIEVLEELHKSGSKVPVIILSNVMSSETREVATKYGVVDYIIKSDLTPSQVLEKIEKYL